MLDVTTLTCPSCGGKLETIQDVDRFVCAHCGTEQIVHRDELDETINKKRAELKHHRKIVNTYADEQP